MVLELRPAHDPGKSWGFVGVVISVADLSASVWLWQRDGEQWAAKKVITIPAERADASELPPALQPFGAVPPLISDIDLSVDDRWLYVSCWGTGELKQYDVSDPHNPVETGSVRLGGVVQRTPHPSASEAPLAGGPQLVEISRDGRRGYFTNSLHAGCGEARRLVDRIADHGVLVTVRGAYVSCHHFARGDTNSGAERRELPLETEVQLAPSGQRRCGRVGLLGEGPEDAQRRVALELVDPTAVVGDHLDDDHEATAQGRHDRRWLLGGGNGGRADQIDAQDRGL